MRRPLASLAATALITPALLALGAAPAHAALPGCGGLTATIVGTPGDDTIVGTPGDDVIRGFAGDDVIHGRGGHDVICGNFGHDDLTGGPGADRVFGDRASDHLNGGVGDDRLDEGNSHLTGLVEGAAGDDLMTAEGSAEIDGGEGNDTVTVTNAFVTVDGGPGDDHIDAAGSFDTLELDYRRTPNAIDADLAAGTVDGWGHDTVPTSGQVAYFLLGTAFDDAVTGTSAGDTLFTGEGDDTIQSGDGNDNIDPGPGDDVVDAGPGDDVVTASQEDATAHNVVHGGDGHDILDATQAGDKVYGDAGDDFFRFTRIRLGTGQVLDGGAGRNLILFSLTPPLGGGRWRTVGLDMGAGTVDGTSTTGSEASAMVAGFNRVILADVDLTRPARRWTVIGTDGRDDIRIDDGGKAGRMVVHGLGDDDRISTGGADDTIDGGDGADSANASGGTDTCISIESGIAGRPTSCEVNTP
jgi:Ca2+-binding RTX toxin-like protein